MEVLNVLEDTRKGGRIGEEVPHETHQQTTAAGVCDPPLLSVVVVAAIRVIIEITSHYLFRDLIKQRKQQHIHDYDYSLLFYMYIDYSSMHP